MNEKIKLENIFRRIAPKGVTGWIGLIIIVILAFSFGIMTSGENDSQATTQEEQDNNSNKVVWTCSMHPQIRLPKPGKCPICFMDLIPLETGIGEDLGPRQLMMSESAKNLARIQTTSVRRAFTDTEIRMTGKLSYDETRLSFITAWTGGRLDKLYADFTGITVAKGEAMVQLYSPELFASQEELLQAIKVESLITDENSILKKTAKATIEAVEEKLRLAGLTDDQIEEIINGGNAADKITIYSPAGGVVTEIHAREGNYVKTGDQIYTIADLSSLWVILDAYEPDLTWLKKGQQLTFTTPSYPGKEFKGKIAFIDPVVDQKTRTTKIRAIVNNSDLSLKPDMFVSGVVKARLDMSGSIAKNNSDAPLLIPATAPLITGTRAVVYVELPSDEGVLFEGREIELGPRSGDFYIVKSGLEENDLVVTNGAFKLDSELQIQAKPSMMSPKGGVSTAVHQHGQQTQGTMETMTMESDNQSQNDTAVTKELLLSLSPVYNAYFKVQMGLADDELETTTAAYALLEKEINGIDHSLFKGSAHKVWMDFSSVALEQIETGKSSTTLEEARQAFYHLSKAIIELHDKFGHTSDLDYFLTFCPMARNNQGAYWLQTVDTVYNSFYGSKMLRCGSIKDTLPSITVSEHMSH
ncbi:MAG: efflux RND transporter periplasmic adaptor subunit [bacterium]